MYVTDLFQGAVVAVAAVIAWGVLFWIAGAFLAGWVASEQRRDPVAWFLLAFFLSPPVALVALAGVPPAGPPSAAPAARPLRSAPPAARPWAA